MMRSPEFRHMVKGLIPSATDASITRWKEYAEEYADNNTSRAGEAFEEFYAQFALVRRKYGEDIVTKLFELPATDDQILNPFELPGAAKMLADGMPTAEICENITYNGYSPTQEEADELRAMLSEIHGEQPSESPVMSLSPQIV